MIKWSMTVDGMYGVCLAWKFNPLQFVLEGEGWGED